MITPNHIINQYTDEYSEWKEELGEGFPQFLIYKLAADLAKERNKSEYLERVAYARR